MINVDSFLEWFVILVGIFIGSMILFPAISTTVALFLEGLLPDPDTAAEWLRKMGL